MAAAAQLSDQARADGSEPTCYENARHDLSKRVYPARNVIGLESLSVIFQNAIKRLQRRRSIAVVPDESGFRVVGSEAMSLAEA